MFISFAVQGRPFSPTVTLWGEFSRVTPSHPLEGMTKTWPEDNLFHVFIKKKNHWVPSSEKGILLHSREKFSSSSLVNHPSYLEGTADCLTSKHSPRFGLSTHYPDPFARMLVCQRRRRLEKVSNPEDTNSMLTGGRQVKQWVMWAMWKPLWLQESILHPREWSAKTSKTGLLTPHPMAFPLRPGIFIS